jgi:hypothetical protein
MARERVRLSPGERLIGVSGVALFAVSFLHWVGGKIASFEVNGQSLSGGGRYHFEHQAWHYLPGAAAVLIGVLLALYVGLRWAGVVAPPRGPARPQLLAVCGAVAFLLVLVQLFVDPHLDLASFNLPSTANLGGTVRVSFATTHGAGIYAGLVATIGLFAGGYLTLRGS